MKKISVSKGVGAILRAIWIYIAIRVLSSDILVTLNGLEKFNDWTMFNLITQLFSYQVTETFILFGIGIVVYHRPRSEEKKSWIVFSAFWALMTLLGYSFRKTDSWECLFGSINGFALFLFTWAGLSLLCRVSLDWLFRGMECLMERRIFTCGLFARSPFLFSWGLILLCYVPYIIIRYPAGIEFDAYYQIEQFLGMRPMTAHWPPVSSAFMGFWVWLGKAVFDSYNIGVFMLVIVQTLICSGVLAYSVCVMRRLNVSENWQIIALIMYAVSPVFAGYLTSVIKDALFSAVVVWFICLLTQAYMLPGNMLRHILLGIAAALMCLLRNNGVYILIICLVIYVGILLRNRSRDTLLVTAAMVAALLVNGAYNSVVLPYLEIPKGSVAEALSIPFQQTARYVREYPEDVTEDEAEIIEAVLDYENLAELYDPIISDPVKATYHGETEDLIRYLKVWFMQLLRHPDVYFEATLNNIYGYYDTDAQLFIFYDDTRSIDQLVFDEPAALQRSKVWLRDFVRLFESMPGFMLIGNAGVHCWIVVFLLFWTVGRKQWRTLFLLMPSVIGVLVCLASPTYMVNGIRYALPVIYANPFLLGLILMREKERMFNKKGQS